MTVLLEGERIHLRPPESDEDIKYLFRSFNDPVAAGEYVNFEPKSWESFQNWLREAEKSSAQLAFLFIVMKSPNREIIGSVVHFVPSPLSVSCLEIGYGIDDPANRRKGYASEAVKLLVDYLFLMKPLERLQAIIGIENVGSQRVLEKLGFKKEGTLRSNSFVNGGFKDGFIYSLLRREWARI